MSNKYLGLFWNELNKKTKFVLLLTILHFIIVSIFATIFYSPVTYSINFTLKLLIGYICFSFIVAIVIILCSIKGLKNDKWKINICCLVLSSIYLIIYFIWIKRHSPIFPVMLRDIINEIRWILYK